MATFFTEVRQTLVPRGDVKYGPLPPLLVAMTLVTGVNFEIPREEFVHYVGGSVSLT